MEYNSLFIFRQCNWIRLTARKSPCMWSTLWSPVFAQEAPCGAEHTFSRSALLISGFLSIASYATLPTNTIFVTPMCTSEGPLPYLRTGCILFEPWTPEIHTPAEDLQAGFGKNMGSVLRIYCWDPIQFEKCARWKFYFDRDIKFRKCTSAHFTKSLLLLFDYQVFPHPCARWGWKAVSEWMHWVGFRGAGSCEKTISNMMVYSPFSRGPCP